MLLCRDCGATCDGVIMQPNSAICGHFKHKEPIQEHKKWIDELIDRVDLLEAKAERMREKLDGYDRIISAVIKAATDE